MTTSQQPLEDPLTQDDVLRKQIGLQNLLKMTAISSLDRNLRAEDAEMAEWYGIQNKVAGVDNGKESDMPAESIMVAGDLRIAPPPPQVPVSPVKAASGISKALGIGLLSAGLMGGLGGGIGLAALLMKPDQKPAPNQPHTDKDSTDKDSIGIMEPDRN